MESANNEEDDVQKGVAENELLNQMIRVLFDSRRLHPFEYYVQRLTGEEQAYWQSRVALTDDQREEMKTHEQGSKQWLEDRFGRITGSTVGSLLHHNDYQTTIDQIWAFLFPAPKNEIMQRGNDCEPIARAKYKEWLISQVQEAVDSKQWKVEEDGSWVVYVKKMPIVVKTPEETEASVPKIDVDETGLTVLREWPHIGASPDGIISVRGIPIGLLEIKCPWGSNHALYPVSPIYYYDQVQDLMHCFNLKHCHFHVWNEYSDSISYFPFDEVYTHQFLFPRIHKVYFTLLLPLLVYRDKLKQQGVELTSKDQIPKEIQPMHLLTQYVQSLGTLPEQPKEVWKYQFRDPIWEDAIMAHPESIRSARTIWEASLVNRGWTIRIPIYCCMTILTREISKDELTNKIQEVRERRNKALQEEGKPPEQRVWLSEYEKQSLIRVYGVLCQVGCKYFYAAIEEPPKEVATWAAPTTDWSLITSSSMWDILDRVESIHIYDAPSVFCVMRKYWGEERSIYWRMKCCDPFSSKVSKKCWPKLNLHQMCELNCVPRPPQYPLSGDINFSWSEYAHNEIPYRAFLSYSYYVSRLYSQIHTNKQVRVRSKGEEKDHPFVPLHML